MFKKLIGACVGLAAELERPLRPQLPRGRIERLVGVLFHELVQVSGRYAPFLAKLEAAHITVAQPAGNRALVNLEAVGDLGRRQKLFISHGFSSRC